MKIVSVKEMQAIERECVKEGISLSSLMENAGKAVASFVREEQGKCGRYSVLVLTGGGNNGGDGLVAARYLCEWGFKVKVYLVKERKPEDENYKKVLEQGIEIASLSGDKGYKILKEMLYESYAVIDAILGTGVNRPLEGAVKEAAGVVNKTSARNASLKVYAVDVPTGLNADTGENGEACIKAGYTIALGLLKEGFYTSSSAAEALGSITCVSIGIPRELAENVKTELITKELVKSLLPKRFPTSNKGSYGKVMVIAGSALYSGAACLAGKAAARAGAGLVTLAAAKSLHPILASSVLEATHLLLPEESYGVIGKDAASIVFNDIAPYNVVLIGCGISCTGSVKQFLASFLFDGNLSSKKLIIDADALNILSEIENWWEKIPFNAVLTPHPGEMARLTGLSVSEVQADRLNTARKYAKRWNKTIILKGANTVIAAPCGRVSVCGEMVPALSTAGTGDVLAGAVAGLAAQGLDLYGASCLGVYVHAKSGVIASSKIGETGVLAGDLLKILPEALKELRCF